MQEKRLARSSTNKMVAGVCAGLAQYLDLDVSLVRIAFVILTLLGSFGGLLYIIMWIILPEDSQGTTASGGDGGAQMG